MQREHCIDMKGQASSGRNRGTEQTVNAGETSRNWPWAEAGRHYDWMDRHFPFEDEVISNGM